MNNIGFDLDGTLFDTERSIKKSLELALIENGIDADLGKFKLGPPIDMLLSMLNVPESLHLQIKESFIKNYDQNLCVTCTPLFDFKELFYHLKKYRVFIITNKRRRPTETILNKYKFFDSISGLICSDDADFQSKCNTFTNYEIELYIGDTMEDFHQTQQAGIRFILCDWANNINFSENKIITHSEIYQYI